MTIIIDLNQNLFFSFTPRDIKKDFDNASHKQIKNNNNYNMQIIFAVGFISLTLITYFLFGFN